MIRLAILDFDGTLCNTHEAIDYSLRQTFAHFEVPFPPRSAVERAIQSGVIISEVFSKLCEECDTGAWASKYRAVYDSSEGLARTVLFPGVKDGLSRLNDSGCSLVVLSNKGDAAVREALDHFDLSKRIGLIIGDMPPLPRKPDPASYARVIAPAFSAIKVSECLVVGDTVVDLQYARNIGAHACWACYGIGVPKTCLELTPDVVADSFAEVVEHIIDIRS